MSDAVQEFKIVTTMFDASLGRSNGGALSITTKSGTNEYHGTAFYYTQNEGLNANSWTNNRVGTLRPAVDLYAAGFTVGGPVRMPKYDGHNRTFFFFGYERDRNGNHAPGLAFVPTSAIRQGDFSQTLAPSGAPLAIYDPLATIVNSSGTFQSRGVFPGAVIPSQRLNPIGVAVLGKLPAPNLNVKTQINTPNWTADMHFPQITRSWQTRVDQAVGNRHRLFARVAGPQYLGAPDPPYFPGAYSVPPNGTSNLNTDNRRHRAVTADDTVLFTPSLVGSFRLGYTRVWTYNFMPGDQEDPVDLKLPTAITAHQIAPAWPIFDTSVDGTPFIGSRPRQSVNDIWSFMNNFSKVRGSHTWRFGLDYRVTRWNENNPGTQANGQFVFNTNLTRSNPTQASTATASGSAMASLLLGLPTTASNRGIGYTSPLSLQSQYGGFFFQDDWKVSRRLTLNLGLRYEFETPPTERFDRLLYSFDPAIDLGITVPGVGPLHGGVRFVNDNGVGRRQGELDKNNFGPRVGLAFSPGGNVVVRGGYGIFYSSAINNINTPTTDGAFGALTQYVGTTGGDTQVIPGVSLSNPFPNGYVQPTGKSLGVATDLGSTITYLNPHRVLPYVQQWQFSIQKQFRGQVLGEVAYVGMHSIRLFEDLNLNETPDNILSNTANVPNPFLGLLPPASTLGQGSTIRATQLVKTYPQFSNVNEQRDNTGRVLYHSLQARVQKRFSQGLQLVANYTYSKSMEYLEYSSVNVRKWRAVSPIDYPHMFNVFLTYDLPFGRKRSFGRNWGRALDTLAGGWTLAFLTHYQSGDALTATDTNGTPIPTGDPITSGSYHDRLGDKFDPKTGLPVNPFFSRDVWTHIANFKVSPEPPLWSWFRGPSQWTQTATLSKTISLTERFRADLRMQVSSPFNHPIFNDPSTNLASPATFGVITATRGSSTRSATFGVKLRF
jgi:TonB dependent receptor